MDKQIPFTLIIVDDFRIGGIQRLALDQLYQLSEWGQKAEMLVLSEEPVSTSATFQHSETRMISSKSVEIKYLPGRRWPQAFKIRRLIKFKKYEVIIAHSLRSAVIIKLFCYLKLLDCKVIVTIHQLPSLSAKVQRTRRFIYSQFSDSLKSYSLAVKRDWDKRRESNILIRLVTFRRKIVVNRNGIYLGRLPILNMTCQGKTDSYPRLVFIGRLTAWKGLTKFLEIASSEALANYQILLITPTDPTDYLSNLEPSLRGRISVEIGKSVSNIEFYPTDIHLYPADYGIHALFVESISLNVLEMACLGIRSIVTATGTGTWPELAELGIVIETDWSNISKTASLIADLPPYLEEDSAQAARKFIDIRNNLSVLLDVDLAELP